MDYQKQLEKIREESETRMRISEASYRSHMYGGLIGLLFGSVMGFCVGALLSEPKHATTYATTQGENMIITNWMGESYTLTGDKTSHEVWHD